MVRGNPASILLELPKKGNLRKVTAAQHNKLHPEKGRKAAAAQQQKSVKRHVKKQQGEIKNVLTTQSRKKGNRIIVDYK